MLDVWSTAGANAAPKSAIARVAVAGLNGIRRLARALANRQEVKRLAEMDDRSLKDIGLVRSDVTGALAQPFHKDPSAVLLVRRVERRARSRPVVTIRPRPERRESCPV
jgi:uncharacterized protein YjiS (DUF1127 family)